MGFKIPDELTWLDWYDDWLDNDLLNLNFTPKSPKKWDYGL